MSDISLTASMRSNLLSLQQISKLQDQTQLRLSTGLKVNSAIDNPSSYYTASSLTNRADDLSALPGTSGVLQTETDYAEAASEKNMEKVMPLLKQKRIDFLMPADYSPNSRIEQLVKNSLKKCLRILIVINTELGQKEIKHVYLKNAEKLREDLK